MKWEREKEKEREKARIITTQKKGKRNSPKQSSNKDIVVLLPSMLVRMKGTSGDEVRRAKEREETKEKTNRVRSCERRTGEGVEDKY